VRALSWGVLAAVGFGLMLSSQLPKKRTDPPPPWASGFLALGDAAPSANLEIGARIPTRLRILHGDPFTQQLVDALSRTDPARKTSIEVQVLPKLIEVPVREVADFDGWLSQGRLPEPGDDEVLAGAQKEAEASLSVAGRTLRVVGVLPPRVALFSDSFLIPAHPSLDPLFPEGDSAVHRGTLVRLGPEDLDRRETLKLIGDAYPSSNFTLVLPRSRPSRPAFRLYLGGQALFLLGGTGLLIAAYRALARRSSWSVWAAALNEIEHRRRLLWGVHLVYFGIYLAGALAVFEAPALQKVLIAAIGGELSSEGQGPLAIAGRAYRTGNMLYAALVTFLINFPLGSVAMISLPSLVVPGSGALLAVIRATSWGLFLSPSEAALAWMMIPHSLTLLLEGGGYILATFFAILVPLYLLGSAPAPPRAHHPPQPEDDSPQAWNEAETASSWRDIPFPAAAAPPPANPLPPPRSIRGRFAAAGLLNLQGNILVAAVLAIAALYEAVEVILMAGF
jgi:hypothetical protein